MSEDALSNTELKRRSVKGAKWLILTNLFGMPAAYAIVFFLGRTGPEALGAYGLAQIFIGVVTTFALFGGTSTLRNYLPKVIGPDKRGHFLYSYGVMSVALMLAVLALFYFAPALLEFLLQREFNPANYGWFALLTVIVVVSECLIGATAGMMHISLAALARMMTRVVLLPLVAVLFFFGRDTLHTYTLETILIGYLVSYGVGAVLCVAGIARDPRFKLRARWHVPAGFEAFAVTSSAAAVFSFFYANFDRMCVLGLTDLAGLGMYQAVLSLMMLVEYVPTVLQTAVVPLFSRLQGTNQIPALKRAYNFINRNTVLLIASLSLVMIGFSREILEILGEGYGTYHYLLALYSFVSIVRAPAWPGLAILISLEKNSFRLLQSIAQLSAQALLTMLFINSYGVLAIAGAKMLAGGIATFVGILYVVYGLKMAPGLARSYKVALVTGLVLLILRIAVLSPGWTGSILSTGGALAALAIGSRLSVEEARAFLRIMTSRNFNVSMDAGKKDF